MIPTSAGGVCGIVSLFPPSLLRLCLRRSCPLSPFPWPLGCVRPVVWLPGLANMWAFPWRQVNYIGHYGPSLLLWLPPSHLMGDVHPLRLSVPIFLLLFPPLHHFVLRCGASAGFGGRPPSPVSGHARRACAPARGVTPPPLFGGMPPPPSLLGMSCARSARCSGGAPSSSTSWSPPPPNSCKPCVGRASCLGEGGDLPPQGQGFPPCSYPACCARGAHAAVCGGYSLPSLPSCALG